MSNPQLEDGYTRIANEILERLMSVDLSGHEFRILLVIFRKTYGFGKCEDYISLSQIMSLTGLSKTRCSQVINRLQLRKTVTVTENCNGLTKKYKFNKDLDSWVGGLQKSVTVTQKCNRPLRKSVTTKETITKEKYNNKKPAIQKIIFHENVALTENEKTQLIKDYSLPITMAAIQFLSDYKKEKGYKTKSDYLTIKRWVIKAVNEQKGEINGNQRGYAGYKRPILTERDIRNQAGLDEAELLRQEYYRTHPSENGGYDENS